MLQAHQDMATHMVAQATAHRLTAVDMVAAVCTVRAVMDQAITVQAACMALAITAALTAAVDMDHPCTGDHMVLLCMAVVTMVAAAMVPMVGPAAMAA